MLRSSLAVLSILLLAGAAHAGDADPAAGTGWEFAFAPYFWAAGLEGDIDAENVSADIDVAFSDIWDALDMGLLTAFETRNGRFSVATNAIYLKLSTEAKRVRSSVLPSAPPRTFEVRSTMEEIIFELFPRFEVLSLPLLDASGERRIALDLGPGGRAFWLNTHLDVKLTPGVPLGPFSRRFDERIFWVDLVGTARVRAQLAENVRLVVAGDYGGFDIGSSSHKTWSLQGYLDYALGEHWTLVGGWRTLEIERGSVQLEMAGPLFGASYRF
jgi:hypothetical protein